MRWNFILVWFMRMLALIWIAKGLGYWAVILGADSAPMPFESRSTGFQATTIYFAIIDLVAAVGLWLTLDLGRGAVAPGRDEPPDPDGVLSPDRHGRAHPDRAVLVLHRHVSADLLARGQRRVNESFKNWIGKRGKPGECLEFDFV